MSTRRQRAAYELALCVLRESVASQVELSRRGVAHAAFVRGSVSIATDALDIAGSRYAWAIAKATKSADIDQARILRARLALYLRAWLRADAGDCGPVIEWLDGGWSVVSSRRITPLWERAGGER